MSNARSAWGQTKCYTADMGKAAGNQGIEVVDSIKSGAASAGEKTKDIVDGTINKTDDVADKAESLADSAATKTSEGVDATKTGAANAWDAVKSGAEAGWNRTKAAVGY